MMEKSLIIIIFMYASSIGLLATQWALGDVFHITMTDTNGHPLNPQLITNTNISSLNVFAGNVTGTSVEKVILNVVGIVGGFAWALVQLLTGTTIFNVLLLFGVPPIAVYGISALYILLLMRMVLGYVRGI